MKLEIIIPISILKVIDHVLHNIILCSLVQLPESIACYLSNNVIKLMVYWQSILHFSGFLFEFQSFLVDSVSRMFLSGMNVTIFLQLVRSAFWEL